MFFFKIVICQVINHVFCYCYMSGNQSCSVLIVICQVINHVFLIVICQVINHVLFKFLYVR